MKLTLSTLALSFAIGFTTHANASMVEDRYYALDGNMHGVTNTNWSGNYGMSIVGNESYGTDRHGNANGALYLDGNSYAEQRGFNQDLSKEYIVDFWFNRTGDGGPSSHNSLFQFLSSGNLRAGVHDNQTSIYTRQIGNINGLHIPNNQWHRFTYTHTENDNGTYDTNVYLNETLATQITGSNHPVNLTSNFHFGVFAMDTAYSFEGLFDDIRIIGGDITEIMKSRTSGVSNSVFSGILGASSLSIDSTSENNSSTVSSGISNVNTTGAMASLGLLGLLGAGAIRRSKKK